MLKKNIAGHLIYLDIEEKQILPLKILTSNKEVYHIQIQIYLKVVRDASIKTCCGQLQHENINPY